MATIYQIRGMLLEEAILFLLRTSGYKVVEDARNDPTLFKGKSGLELLGRGTNHQIDGVADFRIPPPFSNPQRLLLEAKFYSSNRKVGLPVIRNAVGTLKDVSEYWVTNPLIVNQMNDLDIKQNRQIGSNRYHYQYALFSATGYSPEAEKYAFAQDIFLIQYAQSYFFNPVITSIREVSYRDFEADRWDNIDVNMTELRKTIRDAIKYSSDSMAILPRLVRDKLSSLVDSVHEIKGTLLATIGRKFPIHLIPAPGLNLSELNSPKEVHIRWDERSWYLTEPESERQIFSFDLPRELFRLYADNGVLTASRALDLKSDMLDTIEALLTIENEIRWITFKLDQGWINRVRQRIGESHTS